MHWVLGFDRKFPHSLVARQDLITLDVAVEGMGVVVPEEFAKISLAGYIGTHNGASPRKSNIFYFLDRSEGRHQRGRRCMQVIVYTSLQSMGSLRGESATTTGLDTSAGGTIYILLLCR